MPKLTDSALARTKSSIDGAWCDGAKGKFVVSNAADVGTLVESANGGVADAQRAIDAAAKAPPAWHARTAKERAGILREWFDLVLASQDDLAKRMRAEQHKPIVESRGKIAYGASPVEWFAEQGQRLYGDLIPTPQADKPSLMFKEPIGISAARAAHRSALAGNPRTARPASHQSNTEER